MARRATEIKVGKIEFRKPDGSLVPWSSLTAEEIAEIRARWSAKLSEVLSGYYSRHPEEYVKLQGLRPEEVAATKASVPGGHPSTDKTQNNLQAGQAKYNTPAARLQ